MASWDADKREYVASVGGQSLEGLGLIVKTLGENGWEIISVVPLEGSSASTGSPSKANHKSRTATDVLALFVKRHRGVPDGPTSNERVSTASPS